MRLLPQRSIATQARVALGGLALLMALGSLGLLLLARRAATSAGQVYRDHLQPMMRLTEVTEAYTLDITVSFRMVRTGRMSPAEGTLRLREGEAKAGRNWAAYRAARPHSPDLQHIDDSLARLRVLGNRMAAMYPNSVGYDELGFFGDREWLPEVLACSKLLQGLRDEEDRGAEAAIASLEGTARRTLAMGLLLMVGSLALALALGQGFASQLRQDMESLVARLRKVADGELQPAREVQGESELAIAERELNRTAARLQQLLDDAMTQKALEQAILDGAHAVIIGLDLEGRVSRWNRAAEVMLGYRAEEVVGQATPILWRLPEELAAMAGDISQRVGRDVGTGVGVLQVAASIPGFTTRCRYRARDGALVPVLLSLSQVRGPGGDLLGTMGIALDLRDLEKLKDALKDSEERYRRLAERLPGVVYQTQVWPDGRQTWPFISPQFAELFGTEPRAWAQNPDYLVARLHPEDRSDFLRLQEAATRQLAPLQWEGRVFTERSGEVKWLRVRSNPAPQVDGSILWDGLMEDVTVLKQAEEALRLSETMAQEASRAKSAFLASMSHELRTPLSAILGYSRLMARDPARSEEDQVQLEHVLRAGEHLLSLINDVLSLSKIEAGRTEVRRVPFDPTALVREVEALFRLTALSKGLAFEVEMKGLPRQVEGDPAKLRQVLVNLLGNAMKFTVQGGVTFCVAWAQDMFSAVIEDTGPGIPEAERKLLFGAFNQASQGHTAGGTGLGLHISRALVSLMGGEIGMESEVGRGSRFHFQLPLPETEVPAQLAAHGRVARLAEGEAPHHVLIVDDRMENRDILDRLLTVVGFRCSLAGDGQEALAQWESGCPELILMDLRMPVMDGFEAVARIRAREAETGAPRTPVVAISASVYDVSREDLLKRGFDAFLMKPIDEDQLFEALETFLNLRFSRTEGGAEGQGEGSVAGLAGQDSGWRARFLEEVATGDLEAAEALLPELRDEALRKAVRQRLRTYNLEDLLHFLR
jgi:PAS domain S-box-containing protein